MKHKELIIIVGVGFISALLSIVISSAVFGTPKKNPIKVPVVQKISSDFPNPQNDQTYSKIYNTTAINPTQLIRIGGSNNSVPFQGASN